MVLCVEVAGSIPAFSSHANIVDKSFTHVRLFIMQ